MEITIPWTPVKALLNLAGKTDIRAWVNGVWVDRQGPTLVIWATTGFALGAIRTEEPSTEGPSLFLPRHILEEACKGFDVLATVTRADDGRMSISCMGSTHVWQDMNFTPVDWRRVVPTGHCDGKLRQFNVEFLPAFVKVREALKGKSKNEAPLLIAHRSAGTGVDGLLVELVDVPEFVGVIMPLNDKALAVVNLRTVAPDWVRLHPRTEAPADEPAGADLA